MSRKHLMRKLFLFIAAFMAFSLLAGPGVTRAQEGDGDEEVQAQTETQATAGQTIYEIIQSESSLSDFEALVDAAALSDNLDQDGPFTVFAPTNEAWAEFNAATDTNASMTEVLLYHVMNGEYTTADLAQEDAVRTLSGKFLFFNSSDSAGQGGIVINDSVTISQAGIPASNGVVHIIDTVLPIPEGNTVFATEEGSPDESIVEVLEQDGRFDSLLALLEQTGMVDELQNPNGNYTLFAPTDEAFEQADEALVEEWLTDPQGALSTIISYHIINDRLSINQIANDDYLPTLEGRAIAVTTDENVQVYLNGRPVQSFNILADNGIIHVMDDVILP